VLSASMTGSSPLGIALAGRILCSPLLELAGPAYPNRPISQQLLAVMIDTNDQKVAELGWLNRTAIPISPHVTKWVSLALQHLLVTFLVFRIFVGHDSLWLKGRPADFGAMIDGTADRPFVMRTLIPSTIRLVRDALPESMKMQLAGFLGSKAWYSEYFHSNRAVEFAIALPLVFLLILGFSLNLRRLARTFYPGGAYEETVTVLLGTMLIALCFAYGHYIYDPGTLFFIAHPRFPFAAYSGPEIASGYRTGRDNGHPLGSNSLDDSARVRIEFRLPPGISPF